ncbi:MAG: 50S ribosomal protein L13 [bacterium]|nr:50S ribosomal protein L13 [bacterium]
MYKTYQPTQKEVIRDWHLVNAKGGVLGRIATQIATFLIGKHKAGYSAHMDSGDFVVVTNCEKVILTGKKKEQKVYRGTSGYPGGFKEVSFAKMSKEHPERVITHAVFGMLPDNRLKKDRMARLKVVKGEDHTYQDRFNK